MDNIGYIVCRESEWNESWDCLSVHDVKITDMDSIMNNAVFYDDTLFEDAPDGNDGMLRVVFKTKNDAQKFINWYNAICKALPACIRHDMKEDSYLFISPTNEWPAEAEKYFYRLK